MRFEHLAFVLIAVCGLLIETASLEAQSSASLSGVVLDSASGQPLEYVLATLDGTGVSDTTDASGQFQLVDLPAGAYQLSLEKAGFLIRSFQFDITEDLLREVDLGPIRLQETPLLFITLSGKFEDVMSSDPIPEVRIIVNGTLMTVSDYDGTFTLENAVLPVGLNFVQFRHVKYEPLDEELWIANGDSTFSVSIAMKPLAYELEEIVVEGQGVVLMEAKLRPFFQRLRTERGEFLTPWDIEKIPAQKTTDILGYMRNLLIRPGQFRQTIEFTRAFGECRFQPPEFWLDGVRVGDINVDVVTNPQDVVAVEVYTGGAQIPNEFKRLGTNCGVIVIWTR